MFSKAKHVLRLLLAIPFLAPGACLLYVGYKLAGERWVDWAHDKDNGIDAVFGDKYGSPPDFWTEKIKRQDHS
jgi:TRAP-type mannitol/chloroaromatic compound transport system permease small subunit